MDSVIQSLPTQRLPKRKLDEAMGNVSRLRRQRAQCRNCGSAQSSAPMNLNLYKAILSKRPDNEQGMKAPSLEVISFILTTVVISALTIWAVVMIINTK